MKKLWLMAIFFAQSALAQMPNLEIFHEGAATEAVAEKMGQAMFNDLLSNSETIEKMSEQEVVHYIMDSMKQYSGEMVEAMKQDCSVNNPAKDCACFYDKVDMNVLFDEIKILAGNPDLKEEEVEKELSPIMEKFESQKKQCGLK
ncbi:MAG: hypothetical protein Q4B71_02775 [Cardiobacteriaceae bacterium]|nr:hypothetical protein [Cardiobacteriaceae bacterium]